MILIDLYIAIVQSLLLSTSLLYERFLVFFIWCIIHEGFCYAKVTFCSFNQIISLFQCLRIQDIDHSLNLGIQPHKESMNLQVIFIIWNILKKFDKLRMIALHTHGTLLKCIIFLIFLIKIDLKDKSLPKCFHKFWPLQILDFMLNFVGIPPFESNILKVVGFPHGFSFW